MQFKIEKAEDVTVLQLRGDTLDASNVAEFKSEITAIFEHTPVKVLFDMEGLKYIDSSGLGAMISCLRTVKAAGGDLKLCRMSPSVRALFELVRLQRIFEICDTREEGLARFGSA